MTPRKDPWGEDQIIPPWVMRDDPADDDFWDRVDAARDRLKEDPW